MFPLQILVFFLSLVLVLILVCWFTFLPFICYDSFGRFPSNGTNICENNLRYCGDTTFHLKSPLRFEGDPSVCGSRQFELSCQSNRTMLRLNGYLKGPYYVDVSSIEYYKDYISYSQLGSVRLIDPGMQKNNCYSRPLNSRCVSCYSETGVEVYEWVYYSGPEYLVFVSCKNPVKRKSKSKSKSQVPVYVDTASCDTHSEQFSKNNGGSSFNKNESGSSTSYDYVAVGSWDASEIEDSCTVNQVVPANISDSLINKVGDISFQEIHNQIADGFLLRWTYSSSGKDLTQGTLWCT